MEGEIKRDEPVLQVTLLNNQKARKNEMYVKYIGAKMLQIPWYYMIYIIKPLFAYLMPSFIYKYIHRHKRNIL